MTNVSLPIFSNQNSFLTNTASSFGNNDAGSAFGSLLQTGNVQPGSTPQMMMLSLVLQLLQQILGGVSDTGVQGHEPDAGAQASDGKCCQSEPAPVSTSSQPTTPQPTAPVVPKPQPITLDNRQQQVLDSTFARDNNGLPLSGHTVQVLDKGAEPNNKLSAGDVVQVLDAKGELVSSSTLQSGDVYELEFRANQLKNVESLGSGWEFTEKLVEINGGQLAQPEFRLHTPENGGIAIEQVVERNEFWEVVERDSSRFLVMRTQDDAGNPIQPSDAINHVFANRDEYAFDCASPVPLLNLKSTLDTVGADDFNQRAGQIQISGWHDGYDTSAGDGGYISNLRKAEAGTITVDGVSNSAGEVALFDQSKGDQLVAGGVYYFELPGDTSSAVQGWNAVYLGQNENGEHRFWSNSIGEQTVRFENGSWKTSGDLEKYYLSAAISDPNVARLENWDADHSALS